MKYLPVRNHVSSIPDNEHVSNIGLGEPGGQHPGVHAGDEHGLGGGVVPHPLELLQHVDLPVPPVLYDALQHILDTLDTN